MGIPQNRIILCKALSGDKSALSMANQAKLEAHVKLKRAYVKAHSRPKRRNTFNFSRRDFCFNSAVIGLVARIVLSNLTLYFNTSDDGIRLFFSNSTSSEKGKSGREKEK